MKKLLFALSAMLGLAVCAQDIKESVYELIQYEQYASADSLLQEWEKKDAGNPEIFAARFNFYLNQAHNSYIVVDSDTMPVGEAMMLADSTGQLAGSIHEETVWNDSLFNEAMKVIDRGIALHPDRLDFRYGKASAYRFVDNYDKMSAEAMEILERSRKNGCKWLWTDNEPIEDAEKVMLDGIHDYEIELADRDASSELLDLNLQYYPSDYIALNIKGSLAYNAGDEEAAQQYFEKAHAAAPDDALITCNLALLTMENGNYDKAKELFKSVLENPEADPQVKETAEEMMQQMNTELKKMRLYDFEFKFLPTFAAGVKRTDGSAQLLAETKYITGRRLARSGYTSPVDYKDIEVTEVENGDGTIVVWTMPMPDKAPLARYIAFLPDKENNCYNVYTLEKTINWDDNQEDIWIIGRAKQDGHGNFGGIIYPETPQEFVAELLKRIGRN